jgi:hypothetical protein
MRRLLLNTALVLASLTIGLMFSEVALRAIGFDHGPVFQPDEVTGLSLRPGTHGANRLEGQAYISINSQGLRDRERPIDKPADTYRIAVLGDSYAEAFQVDVETTFWRLLEKRLQACAFQPGKTIDVMNFGVSGFGTGQELRMLQTRALRYKPDLVILAFFQGNDVRNNSRELEEDKVRPFFFIDENGALKLDDSFARSAEFQRRNGWLRQLCKELSRHSRTLQLVYYVKDVLQPAPTAAASAVGEPGLDDEAFVQPKDSAWRNAWKLTERLIAETKETSVSAGADFVLVTLSVGIQVRPEREIREAFAKKLGVEDLFYPERRLLQLGKSTGIRVITLAPELQAFADRKKVYLHGFKNTAMGSGHWNEAGHAVAAEILARNLCGAHG